ncbi:MAG: NUDIX domain-containing protein [Ferruginibacter sp.]|nr:NUDIX domain-containing protein [Cytophagales bacterium]
MLKVFGHRLRLRVCGFCVTGNQVLLVRHRGIGPRGEFWSPPGGGLQFGESVHQALEREFREETGMDITVGAFLCVSEFLGPPLHAVELFFEVRIRAGFSEENRRGLPLTGTDPELLHQMIEEVRFWEFEAIKRKDPADIHHLFRYCRRAPDLLALRGYFFYRPE